jgi:hypothetical protein
MFTAPTYQGQQSATPLPRVAARAALQRFAAARPRVLTVAQAAGRLVLTGAIVTGLASLFAALIASSLH